MYKTLTNYIAVILVCLLDKVTVRTMASATINVFVKLPTGKAIELHHLPGESVRDIAKKVADSEKVPENRVRIKYQGKQLDKKKTISYLGICEETILKAEVIKILFLAS